MGLGDRLPHYGRPPFITAEVLADDTLPEDGRYTEKMHLGIVDARTRTPIADMEASARVFGDNVCPVSAYPRAGDFRLSVYDENGEGEVAFTFFAIPKLPIAELNLRFKKSRPTP